MAIPGLPYRASLEGGGAIPDFGKAVRTAMDTLSSRYKPQKAAEDLLNQRLMNAMNKPKAEHAEEITMADLLGKRANTNLQNLHAQQLGITNKSLPEKLKLQLDAIRFKSQHPDLFASGNAGQVAWAKYYQDLADKENKNQEEPPMQVTNESYIPRMQQQFENNEPQQQNENESLLPKFNLSEQDNGPSQINDIGSILNKSMRPKQSNKISNQDLSQAILNSMRKSGGNQQTALEKARLYQDAVIQKYGENSPEAKDAAAQVHKVAYGNTGNGKTAGAVGQAIALNEIREKYGEDSQIYKDAKDILETENEKKKSTTERNRGLNETQNKRSSTAQAKAAQELEEIRQGKMPGGNGEKIRNEATKNRLEKEYEARASRLKGSEEYVYDKKTHEPIGVSRPLTPPERKEESGRSYFSYIAPKIAKAVGYYSGKDSNKNFISDAKKYGKDESATKRIDEFLLAKNLISSELVKENATIGGANTNQVYNRLIKSLDPSDIYSYVEKGARGFVLPNTAMIKAGIEASKYLNTATTEAKEHVPARRVEYFNPEKQYKEKHGYTERDMQDTLDAHPKLTREEVEAFLSKGAK